MKNDGDKALIDMTIGEAAAFMFADDMHQWYLGCNWRHHREYDDGSGGPGFDAALFLYGPGGEYHPLDEQRPLAEQASAIKAAHQQEKSNA